MAYITIAELRDYLDLEDTDTYIPDSGVGVDTLTLESTNFRNTLKTGTEVTVASSTADPPAPLVTGTVYYVILGADQVIQLAATSALAAVPTPIVLNDDGTGTHTITREDADTALLADAISAAEAYIESQTNRRFCNRDTYIPDSGVGVDTLTLESINFHNTLQTATPVTVASTLADPPAPLVEGTVYYVILVVGTDRVIQLATTSANAVAGTAINLTDDGTGTHTIIRLETRYYRSDALSDEDGHLLLVDQDLLTINTLANGDALATAIAATEYWLHPRNLGPPYFGIRMETNSASYWQFDTDCFVAVTGTWGFSATAPGDIKMACLHLAAFYHRKAAAQVFDVTAIPDAGVITIPQGIPATVTRIINRYRKCL